MRAADVTAVWQLVGVSHPAKHHVATHHATAKKHSGTTASSRALASNNKGDDNGNNDDNGKDDEYKPGKGCGDKNHVHAREDECKKPPK